MVKLLSNVGFALTRPGWHPLAVTDAKLVPVKSAKNLGAPQVSIEFTVTGQVDTGNHLWLYCALTGKAAGFGREKLEAIQPSVDWADYDWPDDFPEGFGDAKAQARIKEALEACECYGEVEHVPSTTSPGRMMDRLKTVIPFTADPPLAEDNEDGELVGAGVGTGDRTIDLYDTPL
mgnify:CR=1 FL=1